MKFARALVCCLLGLVFLPIWLASIASDAVWHWLVDGLEDA